MDHLKTILRQLIITNKEDKTMDNKSEAIVTWLCETESYDWPTKCAIRWGENEFPVSKYITELLCLAIVAADSRQT